MEPASIARPSELGLSIYGSLLRKLVAGWAIVAGLLARIVHSLTQLTPFFTSCQPGRPLGATA